MPAGAEQQAGARARRGPVFDLPPPPDAANDARRGLVRIVDPAGLAVAWFDPGSARCAGFMVRSPDQDRTVWRSVLAAPAEPAPDGPPAGCMVLAAAVDSRSRSAARQPGEGEPGAEWCLRERDPTSVSLETALRDPGRDGGPGTGAVAGMFTARVEDAALSLVLTLRNEGDDARPVVLGLRLIFPPNWSGGLLRVLDERRGEWLSPHSAERPDMSRPAGAVGQGSPDASPAHHRALPVSPPHVVVSCEEGVHDVRREVAGTAGNLALAVLGSPPGEHAVLLPGARADLAISVAVLPVGDIPFLHARPPGTC